MQPLTSVFVCFLFKSYSFPPISGKASGGAHKDGDAPNASSTALGGTANDVRARRNSSFSRAPSLVGTCVVIYLFCIHSVSIFFLIYSSGYLSISPNYRWLPKMGNEHLSSFTNDVLSISFFFPPFPSFLIFRSIHRDPSYEEVTVSLLGWVRVHYRACSNVLSLSLSLSLCWSCFHT